MNEHVEMRQSARDKIKCKRQDKVYEMRIHKIMCIENRGLRNPRFCAVYV